MFTNIKYFPKTSSSPTKIYFATYNNEEVVLKVHIDLLNHNKNNELDSYLSDYFESHKKYENPKSNKKRLQKSFFKDYNNYKANIRGLEYENKIYKNIISNIVDKGFSSNFIEFIDYLEFTIPDFLNIINPGVDLSGDNLYTETLSLVKTISYIDPFLTYNNYAINDFIKNMRVYCLVTKKPKNTVMNLQEAISSGITTKSIYNILFQVMYNLILMDIIGLQHNDLHLENIILDKLDNPVNLYYYINNQYYMVQTKYMVKIYDWDLSYVDNIKFGINGKINESFWLEYGILNKKVKKFDLYTLICTLNYICMDELDRPNYNLCIDNILSNLFPKAVHYNQLDESYIEGLLEGETYISKNGFFCRPNIHNKLEDNFDDMYDIINNSYFDTYKIDNIGSNNYYKLPNSQDDVFIV